MKRVLAALSAVRAQPAAVQALSAFQRGGGPIPPLLLHGPEGVGKRTAALAFAAALVCRKSEGGDACGACPPCRRVADSAAVTEMREGATSQDTPVIYPDVGFISTPRGKTRISILQARDLALSLSARPYELGRRIYIVDPAERMNLAAANAMLKTLEEPPPFGVLVLISAAPWALPLTVRSRLTPIRFRPLPREIVEQILAERGVAAEEAALRAARSAGSLARALAVDPVEEQKLIALWVGVLEKLGAGARPAEVAALVSADLAVDADAALAALDLLLGALRDVAVENAGVDPVLLEPSARERLAPFASRVLGPSFDRPVLVDRLRREVVIFNRNPRLAVEGAILALAGVLRAQDLPA